MIAKNDKFCTYAVRSGLRSPLDLHGIDQRHLEAPSAAFPWCSPSPCRLLVTLPLRTTIDSNNYPTNTHQQLPPPSRSLPYTTIVIVLLRGQMGRVRRGPTLPLTLHTLVLTLDANHRPWLGQVHTPPRHRAAIKTLTSILDTTGPKISRLLPRRFMAAKVTTPSSAPSITDIYFSQNASSHTTTPHKSVILPPWHHQEWFFGDCYSAEVCHFFFDCTTTFYNTICF